ncbi:MAG: hypothetical protein LBQ57_01595 [Spirochaetales bacterium]|jgi:hypothetical protein|nr:hypothetical protein [Spirochaetales bacterium]
MGIKRPAAAACVLFLFIAALGAQEADYYAALKDLSGENAVLDFVRSEIEAGGGRVSRQDFSGFSGGHSFSHILSTTIGGVSPETLVIAAPAVSGGSSFSAALALSLWKQNAAQIPPVSLLFLFLGGDGDSGFPAAQSSGFPPEEALGTRLFLESFFPEDPAAVLYFDFTEAPGEILCETGTRGIVCPSWMIDRVLASLRDADIPFRIQRNKNQMYRLNLSPGRSPAGEYLTAGFPAIALRGERGPAGETDIMRRTESFSVFFKNYLARNSGGIPREWDQHYFLLQTGDSSYYIIGETVLITALLGVLGLSIFYALIARRRVNRYTRIFLRDFWNLPLILLISMLFFMAGTLFVRAASAIRSVENLWMHYPFVFFLLKAGSAVFLLILSFHHLRRLPFSKIGSFYSAAAIFFFFANVLLFSALDIAFSIFFLWAYTAAVLFSVFKRRFVKFLLIFVSPLPFYFLIYDAFFSAEKDFAGVLLNSPVTGNILLSFIFFPFFLMFIRMDLLFRHPRGGRSGAGIKVLLALSAGLTLAALVFVLAVNPWRNLPQPLSLEEYYSADEGLHELRLAGPSPIGKAGLKFGRMDFALNTGEKTLRLPLEASSPARFYTLRRESFLARRIYRLTVSPPLESRKITLTLSSDAPFVIYDCSFPYSLDIDSRHAEVFIGGDPPLPLDITLTFPAGQSVRAELVSWSQRLSSPLELSGKTFAPASYSKIRDSFIIENND